jgi:Na+-translocating ferredoxin:NAD+ oxidoreductase RNF subunit RnfB
VTSIILFAAGVMLALAMVMAFVLGWANRAFHVEVNPLVDQALAVLPGANCGGCGYVGCSEFAEAVVAGDAKPDGCPVGGEDTANQLADALGVDLDASFPYRPVVHCGATAEERLKRGDYRGERTCAAANLIAGVQGCTYGCLGFGDCVSVCPFDAIHIEDGLATVDYDKCTGCGACERACPRHIISMVPFKRGRMVVVSCSNHDFGKDVKGVCKVGCIGCKACSKHSILFEITDNIARIDYDKYDPQQMDEMQVALEKCPMKRIVWAGEPDERTLAAVADEELPDEPIQARFETTVDKTEWHG